MRVHRRIVDKNGYIHFEKKGWLTERKFSDHPLRYGSVVYFTQVNPYVLALFRKKTLEDDYWVGRAWKGTHP